MHFSSHRYMKYSYEPLVFVLVVVKLNTHEYILRSFDAALIATGVRQCRVKAKFLVLIKLGII